MTLAFELSTDSAHIHAVESTGDGNLAASARPEAINGSHVFVDGISMESIFFVLSRGVYVWVIRSLKTL